MLQEQEPITRDIVALTRRCQSPWQRPEVPGWLRGSGPGYGGAAASRGCGSAGPPQRGRAPRGHFGFSRFPFLRRWNSGTSSAATAAAAAPPPPPPQPLLLAVRRIPPRAGTAQRKRLSAARPPPSRPPRRHLLPQPARLPANKRLALAPLSPPAPGSAGGRRGGGAAAGGRRARLPPSFPAWPPPPGSAGDWGGAGGRGGARGRGG